MKLRSTLLFAAASLAASALAPVQPSAFAATLTSVATMDELVAKGTVGSGVEKSDAYESGTVYSFDGTGAVTNIADSSLVDVFNNANSSTSYVTIAAWVNPETVTGIQTIFSYGGASKGFKLNLYDSGLRFTSKGVVDMDPVGTGIIAVGEWNFVAFTFSLDGVANDRFLFGEKDGSYYSNKNAPTVNTPAIQNFAIGTRNCDGLEEVFSGEIANLTILTSDGLVENSELIAKVGNAPAPAWDNLLWVGPDSGALWSSVNWKNLETGETGLAFGKWDCALFEADASVSLDSDVLATSIEVAEGATLELLGVGRVGADTYSGSIKLGSGVSVIVESENQKEADLTSFSGSGTIEFAAVGSTSDSGDGNGSFSQIRLSDDFNGTLSVTSGVLDLLEGDATSKVDESRLGGTSLVDLNGGGILLRNSTGSLSKNLSVGEKNGVVRVYGNGSVTLTGDISGEGVLSHTDGGSLTFSGEVALGGFRAARGTTIFNGKTVIAGKLEQMYGKLIVGSTDMKSGSYTGTPPQDVETSIEVKSGALWTVENDFVLRNEFNGLSSMSVAGNLVVGNTLWISRDGKGWVDVTGGVLQAKELKFGQAWEGSFDDTTKLYNKQSFVTVGAGGALVVEAITLANHMNSSALTLNGGSLGTSADSLTIDVSTSAGTSTGALPIELAGNRFSTINTSKYENGEFGENGATISVKNALSGKGGLKVAGAGTLTLEAENTYAGGTTVVGGTLIAKKASSLGSGAVAVNGGKLQADNGLRVSQISLGGGDATITGTLALEDGTIRVADGELSVYKLDLGSRLNLIVEDGGKVVLGSGIETEYSVDLNGGTISGLNLTSEDDGNAIKLQAGELGVTSVAAGTLIFYSNYVEEAERTTDYLNNDVLMTLTGGLSLTSGQTRVDVSNLVFDVAGDKYALFNLGGDLDGEKIAKTLNEAGSGDAGGNFLYENGKIVFKVTAADRVALTWDATKDNIWSAEYFQDTSVTNLSKAVRFAAIPSSAQKEGGEDVLVYKGANARSLYVYAGESDVYNLVEPEGLDSDLSLGVLTVKRGTLNVETAMTVGRLEAVEGVLIAGAKDSLFLKDDRSVTIDGGTLQLLHSKATNAEKITLENGSTFAFSTFAESIERVNVVSGATATLEWLDGATDDVAKRVVAEDASTIKFSVNGSIDDDDTWVTWTEGARIGSGVSYEKIGSGVLYLVEAGVLGGTFTVKDGVLALGHAEETGRIFDGDIIVDGESASLLLQDDNSFATGNGSETLGAVELTLKNGGKLLLAETNSQTLINVGLTLGEGALVTSADSEEPNLTGLKLGEGTLIQASGDAEIDVLIQLANKDDDSTPNVLEGSTFEVAEGKTLTLSGAIVDSLENDAGDYALIKTGAGTLEIAGVLSSTNVLNGYTVYTGTTEIKAGTLRYKSGVTPGTGEIAVAEGATLEVDANRSELRFDRGIPEEEIPNPEEVFIVSGEGTLKVCSGTAVFANSVKLASGVVAEGAHLRLAKGATFTGNVDLSGEFGGDGTFKGDITLGDSAMLYAGADEVFTFSASKIAGTHALTKTGQGAVLVDTNLANDFKLTINAGALQSNLEQTVGTLMLAGGTLGTNETASGSWIAGELLLKKGTVSAVQSKLELRGNAGQNNLNLEGALYVGGTIGVDDAQVGSLEVAGTLNLSGNAGGLVVGGLNGSAGGLVSAGTLNVASSVKTITLGEQGRLAFNNANFAGDIQISGLDGQVEINGGVARFAGDESTIEGNLYVDGGSVDVADGSLNVGNRLSGALTKLGAGTLRAERGALNELIALEIKEGTLRIGSVAQDQDDDGELLPSTLEQVSISSGAKLYVVGGVLEFGELGGSFSMVDSSIYTGNLRVSETSRLEISNSKIEGSLNLAGSAVFENATIKNLTWGTVNEFIVATADRPVGVSPAVSTTNFTIEGAISLDKIRFDASLLGSELTLVKYTGMLNADGIDFVGNTANLGESELEERDVRLVLTKGEEGGVLKLITSGTLIWDGVDSWTVGGEEGWKKTSFPDTNGKDCGFENGKYVEFKFGDGDSISVAQNVEVGGVVFNGEGTFTLNFEGGVIQDKEGGYSAVSVLAGTVVFNNEGVPSTDGVFTGGLNIAAGAAVETNSDALIGTGPIALAGKLAFTGREDYEIGEVKTSGVNTANVVLEVVDSVASLDVETLSGTVATKTGAGALTLSGDATLEKFVIAAGNVSVKKAGETGLQAIVLENTAGTLSFENGALLGEKTSLTVGEGREVSFVDADHSWLNAVELAEGATVSGSGTTFDIGSVDVAAQMKATGNATITGDLNLKSTGVLVDVVSGKTLTIDGDVTDDDTDFVLTKTGAGILKITGDVNSASELLLSSGTVQVEGVINWRGAIKAASDVSLELKESGEFSGDVVVATGATLSLKTSDYLSILGDLAVTGTVDVTGKVGFFGSKNTYATIVLTEGSTAEIGADVETFTGNTFKLEVGATLSVGAALSGSAGRLIVSSDGKIEVAEDTTKIAFDAISVEGQNQTLAITGKGEMHVYGSIEKDLTLSVEEDATVVFDNTKRADIGKLAGEGTFRKTGNGDLEIKYASDSSFTGSFVAESGTTYFYDRNPDNANIIGSLGQAKLTVGAGAEIVFARTAVVGTDMGAVAHSLVDGEGTIAVAGSEKSLMFTQAIGSGFTGTLEARDGGMLVYNQVIDDDARKVSLKNAGTLNVAELNPGSNETEESLALGALSLSGKANKIALSEGRFLEIGSVNIADEKGVSSLTLTGAGSVAVTGSITKDSSSRANLDVYTSADFTGTLTLSGADNAHRNTYVNSGTLVIENATAGGTGSVYLNNSVVRFDVAGGDIATTVVGAGTIEGKAGTLKNDLSSFVGSIVAVDNGAFILDKGAATELSSAATTLEATDGATLVVTGSSEQLYMGKASLGGAGKGTIEFSLAQNQTLSVDNANSSFGGTLKISGGTVEVLKDGNLGVGSVEIGNGSTLSLASKALTNSGIGGTGTLVKNTSGTSFVAGTINTTVKVSSGTLSVAAFGEDAKVAVENGVLEFSQTYENGKLVSRADGDQKTFDADYTVTGTARFSHSARNSSSVVDGELDGNIASLIFVGGGAGSVFKPEIDSGDLIKTDAGKWILEGGFSSDGEITVENGGGILVLENYVGKADQEIKIGKDGTLEIAGFADGTESVVKGEISGVGTLTVSAESNESNPVRFDLDGADWMLSVDEDTVAEYGSGLSANDILLSSGRDSQSRGGVLIFNVDSQAKLALDGKTLAIDGRSKDYLDICNATAIKRGAGELDLTDTEVTLYGLLRIEEGSVKAASFTSSSKSGVIEVQGNGTLEIGLSEKTGKLASVAGAGQLVFAAGKTLLENVHGAKDFNRDFTGTVQVKVGATAVLNPYASFGNASRVNIFGTLESSQGAESTLSRLAGDGTLRINNTKSSIRTIYGDNTFSGAIEISSGRLVLDSEDFVAMTNEVKLTSDVKSGLALRNEKGTALSLSDFNGKNVSGTGALFLESAHAAGSFVLVNGKNFGYGSATHVASGAMLKFGEGATLNGGLYVAEASTLSLENIPSLTSLSLKSFSTTSVLRKVEGDLTVVGKLVTPLPDADSVAIHATGTVAIEETAEVEVDGVFAEGDEIALISAGVKAVENGAYFRTKSGERLFGRVAKDETTIMVGLATPISELIPSGLEGLAETIFSDRDSDIYRSIYGSGTDAEQRTKLTNYSPVSFAGVLELSTGLTQLENDLLRQRLEQRRYDRAYPEAEGAFKAYVNAIGSTSESSEGENKSANYDLTHSGAVAGFDTLVNYDFVVGASFTYDFGKAKVHNNGGKHETDTARMNVYGMSMLDDVSYFGFGVGFGVVGLDTKRTNAIETLKGEASGTDISISTTLGRMFVLNAEHGLHVSPYIGLDYTYSRIAGFKENGGVGTALDVDKLERSSLRGTIGATLNWLPNADWRFTLEAAFRHEFLDTDTDIDATFVGGDYKGMSASSTAYFSGEDVISVGPRAEYRINSEWSVSAGYTFESDFDNTTTHSANVGVRCTF